MTKFDYIDSSKFKKSDAPEVIRQYIELKEENKDKIILFRLGEFYETYFEDAITISKDCELALTKRKLKQGNLAMAGVPVGSVSNYIAKLLKNNHKVAICEQFKDFEGKILKRKITRTYSAGTALDDEYIQTQDSNYICAVLKENNQYGLAFCDLACGDFLVTQGEKTEVISEIFKRCPTEILISVKPREIKPFTVIEQPKPDIDLNLEGFNLTLRKPQDFKANLPKNSEKYPLGQKCANAIITYILETQQEFAPKIGEIKYYNISDFLYISEKTRKNLELTKNLTEGKKFGSLFWALDKTKTKMGSRLLANWILHPLKNIEEIQKRQKTIEELIQNEDFSKNLEKILSDSYDIKRLWGKLTNKTATHKDFVLLKDTLKNIESLKTQTAQAKSEFLKFGEEKFFELIDFYEILEKVIEDENANEIIKEGANTELDYIRGEIKKLEKWFLDYEKELIEKTGIKSLKVGYNRVFGYFIEVGNSHIKNVLKDFKIRQNLSSSARYTTDLMIVAEEQINSLKTKKIEAEEEIFNQIKNLTCEIAPKILDFANYLAQIDVFVSLKNTAIKENFIKPEISENISIKGGFHPVAKKILKEFVPNDFELHDGKDFIILTGPNMAGKSTYIKQNAIISILFQMGGYVCAKSAQLKIFDGIYTRIGAVDDLISAKSTFMVEMLDIKEILDNATENSLILLDELGKGTSTKDGLALCYSICEYIIKNIHATTIFATHFHELKNFAENFSDEVESLMIGEIFDLINQKFDRTVKKGFLTQSYGLNVARGAGLPQSVIECAEKLMD